MTIERAEVTENTIDVAHGRSLATVIHASGIFGVLPPLAFFAMLRDEDEGAAEHARLALNWQLTLCVLFVGALVLDVILSALAFEAGAFGIVSALGWLLVVPWAIGAVFAVLGALGVWRTGEYRYPWSIPFVGSSAAARRRALLAARRRSDGDSAADDERPTPLSFLALWFGILAAPLGVVVGHLARARIRRTGELGWGTATAGLAIGYAQVAVGVVLALVVLLSGAIF